jgi:hypothetical protein
VHHGSAGAFPFLPHLEERSMKKMTLDLDTLSVETFATSPELVEANAGFIVFGPSNRSCIEQCTTSCTA